MRYVTLYLHVLSPKYDRYCARAGISAQIIAAIVIIFFILKIFKGDCLFVAKIHFSVNVIFVSRLRLFLLLTGQMNKHQISDDTIPIWTQTGSPAHLSSLSGKRFDDSN